MTHLIKAILILRVKYFCKLQYYPPSRPPLPNAASAALKIFNYVKV